MENSNSNSRPPLSSKLGIITGALLLGLGLWIVYAKPEANQYLAYFMIIYGAIRLGLAIYSNYIRSKDTQA